MDDLDALYPIYLDALLKGDRRGCMKLTQQMLETRAGFMRIYQDIFQKALYEVGKLWENNRISVASEHMATAITESLLNQILPTIVPRHYNGKKIIISSVQGELHKVGAQMICDVFETNGWQSLFLGANTPVEDLQDMLRQLQPDCIGLSMSLYEYAPKLEETLVSIRKESVQMPILLGGQGFLDRENGDLLKKYSPVYLYESLKSLDRDIKADCF